MVGAGLAGLACAWTLHREGHDVVVLEARDRVGGRTWSEVLPNGVVVERGGEWVDADQQTIRWFCAELGLPLVPHGVRFHRRRVGGRVAPLGELEATLDAVERAIPEHGDVTLADAFASGLGPGYTTDPAFLRIATSTAGDPSRASARFHVTRADSARIEGAARVLGGNQRICRALAEELGDRVRLGTPVAAVAGDAAGAAGAAGDDRARLTTAAGEEMAVDRLAVAVPLAVLDEIAFEDGFPEQWRAGLDGLATGTAAKLSVPCAPAAPDGVQHPTSTWWAWNSLDASGDASVAAVSCFAGGEAARASLDVAAGADTWLAAVTALRPDLDLRGDALLTDWSREQWTSGGYSYVLAGRRADADRALRGTAGPLVLAGEHTAGVGSGTMDGALASGVRAARVLLGRST